MQKIGTRALVMHGKAEQTSGGLKKKDLKYNKNGKIVSKKKSDLAKKEKRLEKAGYKTTKGVFGCKKVGGNPDLNFAIQRARIPETAVKINNREGANPDNATFIDETNNRVYKISLMNSLEVPRKGSKGKIRCMENECRAYDQLMKKRQDINIHFPNMESCEMIEGTRYGLLVIQYIPNLIQVDFNNINTKELREEAKAYLKDLGICHNDEEQNLFMKGEDFFWIDFEAATFGEDCVSKNRYNNIKNKKGTSLFGNNNNYKGTGLFGNKNKNNKSVSRSLFHNYNK